MTTLGDLRVGERARMIGFNATGQSYRRKLLALGLTPGVQIEVLRSAPLGDPIEIRVRGSSLSLRRTEAQALNVEKLP